MEKIKHQIECNQNYFYVENRYETDGIRYNGTDKTEYQSLQIKYSAFIYAY